MAKKFTRNNERLIITEFFIGNKLVGHFNALDELPSNQYSQVEQNIMHLIVTNQVKVSQRPAYDPEADEDEDDFNLKLD